MTAERKWVYDRFASMIADPQEWGGHEALEAQFCLLLELMLQFDGEQNPQQKISEAYYETMRERCPMVGSAVAMWSVAGWDRDAQGQLQSSVSGRQNIADFFSALKLRLDAMANNII